MDSSTCVPFTPFVDTTTPLFSRTSRSLRPLHLTTTLMFVSSPPRLERSISDCAARFGVLSLEEALEEALAPNVGVAVCALEAAGRPGAAGGLIVRTRVVVVPASTRWFGALMLGGGCRCAIAVRVAVTGICGCAICTRRHSQACKEQIGARVNTSKQAGTRHQMVPAAPGRSFGSRSREWAGWLALVGKMHLEARGASSGDDMMARQAPTTLPSSSS